MDLSQQKKYKVFMDESFFCQLKGLKDKKEDKWRYCELRGKYGMIYPYSESLLGVQVKAGKKAEGLRRRNPSWKVVQDCDDFVVFLVDNQQLETVSGIIEAKRRRALSDESRKQLAERLSKVRKHCEERRREA